MLFTDIPPTQTWMNSFFQPPCATQHNPLELSCRQCRLVFWSPGAPAPRIICPRFDVQQRNVSTVAEERKFNPRFRGGEAHGDGAKPLFPLDIF